MRRQVCGYSNGYRSEQCTYAVLPVLGQAVGARRIVRPYTPLCMIWRLNECIICEELAFNKEHSQDAESMQEMVTRSMPSGGSRIFSGETILAKSRHTSQLSEDK